MLNSGTLSTKYRQRILFYAHRLKQSQFRKPNSPPKQCEPNNRTISKNKVTRSVSRYIVHQYYSPFAQGESKTIQKKKKNTALITYTLRNILRLVASCYYEFFFVFQSALGELVSDPPTFPRVKHLFNGSYCIP